MAHKDYRPVEWDAALEADLHQLIRLAVREDLDRFHDWTSGILVGEAAEARATITARGTGVVAGLRGVAMVLAEYDRRIELTLRAFDGDRIGAEAAPGAFDKLRASQKPPRTVLAEVRGPAR